MVQISQKRGGKVKDIDKINELLHPYNMTETFFRIDDKNLLSFLGELVEFIKKLEERIEDLEKTKNKK